MSKPAPKQLLSDVASRAIRQAVADVITVENHPHFKIDMSAWWETFPGEGPTCAVCFGGAVMARGLEYAYEEQVLNELLQREEDELSPYGVDVEPDDMMTLGYSESQTNRIQALDLIRHYSPYEISAGLAHFAVPSEAADEAADLYIEWPEYDDDPEGFKRTRLELADKLEALGY